MRLAQRNIVITASAVAVVGFLCMHNDINLTPNLFYDVMHDDIWLTETCPQPTLDQLLASAPGQKASSVPPIKVWPSCNLVLPYRWLLAGCVVAIALALIGWRSNEESGREPVRVSKNIYEMIAAAIKGTARWFWYGPNV